MFNRWIDDDHLWTRSRRSPPGASVLPTGAGSLTDRYLGGVPSDPQVATGGAMDSSMLTEDRLARARPLADIAARRDQSLAQLALGWALRDPRMTSLVIGASSVAQLEDNVGALDQAELTDDELAEIDHRRNHAGINIWARSSGVTSAADQRA